MDNQAHITPDTESTSAPDNGGPVVIGFMVDADDRLHRITGVKDFSVQPTGILYTGATDNSPTGFLPFSEFTSSGYILITTMTPDGVTELYSKLFWTPGA